MFHELIQHNFDTPLASVGLFLSSEWNVIIELVLLMRLLLTLILLLRLLPLLVLTLLLRWFALAELQLRPDHFGGYIHSPVITLA